MTLTQKHIRLTAKDIANLNTVLEIDGFISETAAIRHSLNLAARKCKKEALT